ncbi:cytochrome P450 [Xylariaceae sp. FL1019]|nr:cytochrome P450 [Xylariaceae sp. FL1019]
MEFVSYVLQKPLLLIGLMLPVVIWIYTRLSLMVKLRKIPGHWLSRLTEIPHILALLREDCSRWYTETNQKYGKHVGPLAVVSPGILTTSSGDLWAHMNRAPGYMKSKWFYRSVRFDWRQDNVFTELDIEKHDTRRAKIISGYSGRENLTLESDIDICLTQLMSLIRTGYANGRTPMDLAEKLQFFALDVISCIGFGKRFGLLEADEDPDEHIKSTEAGLRINNRQLALGTWWMNWLPFIGPRMEVADLKTAKGFEKMCALSAEITEAREKAFQEQKEAGVINRADMLTSFMKNGLSGSELKTDVILQIVAGSDTTGGSLRCIFLYIMTNPRVYKKLQMEIDDAVRSGKAPSTPEVISYAQAKQLPYLKAVIREGNQICPPFNNPLARDTPPGGDTVIIEGETVYLPGGISIFPSFTAIQRSKTVFGDDADVFRPERWLEEPDESKLEAMKRTNDLLFGYGRWQCLGKNIALLELSKAIFELLKNFDWGIINPETPWKMATLTGLRSISDFWVQVEARGS